MMVTATKHARERWEARGENKKNKDICGIVKRHLMPALKKGIRPNRHGTFTVKLRENYYATVAPEPGRWVVVTVFTKDRNFFARNMDKYNNTLLKESGNG